MKIGLHLKHLKYDLYGEDIKDSDCSTFFKASKLHLSISLEIAIAHFNNEKISYEKICKNIPQKIGSRSSIQTILNLGTKLDFFKKKELNHDRRVKNFTLSNKYEKMIVDWVERQQKYLYS